jgi:hypothetical protein
MEIKMKKQLLIITMLIMGSVQGAQKAPKPTKYMRSTTPYEPKKPTKPKKQTAPLQKMLKPASTTKMVTPTASFSDVQEVHTRVNNIHTDDLAKVYKKITALYKEMNEGFAKVNIRIDNLHTDLTSIQNRISQSKAEEKQNFKKFLQ